METISYKMPAFSLGGRIVIYFAAFKQHIGLYPPVTGDDKLMHEVAPDRGEGQPRFPFDEPIPYALIGRIVKSKVKAHPLRDASKLRTSRRSK